MFCLERFGMIIDIKLGLIIRKIVEFNWCLDGDFLNDKINLGKFN